MILGRMVLVHDDAMGLAFLGLISPLFMRNRVSIDVIAWYGGVTGIAWYGGVTSIA